jgi:hypothetical protein
MAMTISGVGLFLVLLGVAVYLTGLKDRLLGPRVYTSFLSQNRNATDDMVQRFQGKFYESARRRRVVGRWVAVSGMAIFFVGYAIS